MQTKPAIALISEEIAEKNMSLNEIVDEIVRIITERRLKGINHGVILVPDIMQGILRRNELAAHEVHTTPLDLIVADSSIPPLMCGLVGYQCDQRG